MTSSLSLRPRRPAGSPPIGSRMKLASAAVLATFAVVTPAAHAATATLTPAGAPAGSVVTVSGDGFARGAQATIALRGQRGATLRIGTDRAFTTSVTLPPTLATGRTTVFVRVGRTQLGLPLQVIAPDSHVDSAVTTWSTGQYLYASPTVGAPGKVVQVRGTGFGKRRSVRLAIGSSSRTVRVRRGSFTSSVSLPLIDAVAGPIVIRSQGLLLRARYRTLKPGSIAATGALVDLPFSLDFSSDRGGLTDGAGLTTGFRYLPPTSGTGYVPQNIAVARSPGTLTLTTTAGIGFLANNDQDNALAVGLRPTGAPFLVKTTLVRPPAATRNYEQAGLWLGSDQDNFVKLVVLSTPQGGTRVQSLLEVDGALRGLSESVPLNLTTTSVLLHLRGDPTTGRISASYNVRNRPMIEVSAYTVPGSFFGLDPPWIQPGVGTSSFAGIFATHRLGTQPQRYTFDDFSVTPG